MFMFVFFLLAVVGLVSLLGGAVGSAGAGISVLIAIPIVLFSMFALMAIFGAIGRRRWANAGGHYYPCGRWGRFNKEDTGDHRDRLHEWHRMTHAGSEGDTAVEDTPRSERE